MTWVIAPEGSALLQEHPSWATARPKPCRYAGEESLPGISEAW